MDRFKAQLDRVRQQLAGLGATQKLLAGALALILVGSLFLWTRYAATGERVALFDKPLGPDEQARVVEALTSAQVPFQLGQGGALMVPIEQRVAALGAVSARRALPSESASAFDAALGGMNLWEPQAVQGERFKHARQKMLASVMREWSGVRDAQVLINTENRRTVGGGVQPSASVSLNTERGADVKGLTASAADTVVGAVAGMTRTNVKVIVNGQSQRVADPDAPGTGNGRLGENGSDILQLVRDHEASLTEKLLQAFAHVPGAQATVTVDLNANVVERSQRNVKPTEKLSMAKSERESTSEGNAAAQAMEPAFQSNVGLAANQLPAAGGGGSTSQTETDNVVDYSTEVVTIHTPAGDAVPVGATLDLPYSYFEAVWKRRNPTEARAPSEADLRPLMDAELAHAEQMVRTLTKLSGPSSVVVGTYMDLAPLGADGDIAVAGAPAGLTELLGKYAKELALGVLAAASLFMLNRMVKKAQPVPFDFTGGGATPALAGVGGFAAHDGSASPTSPAGMLAGEHVAGLAGEGLLVMDGHEVDEDVLAARRVAEQVSALVKENPDAAAQLVQRWLRAG